MAARDGWGRKWNGKVLQLTHGVRGAGRCGMGGDACLRRIRTT